MLQKEKKTSRCLVKCYKKNKKKTTTTNKCRISTTKSCKELCQIKSSVFVCYVVRSPGRMRDLFCLHCNYASEKKTIRIFNEFFPV